MKATVASDAPEAIEGRLRVSSWATRLSLLKENTLIFEGSPDDLLNHGRLDTGAMQLHLHLFMSRRRSLRASESWLSTPWSNVILVKERIRYDNGDALAAFFGGLMIIVPGAVGSIVASCDAASPAKQSYLVAGGTVVAIGLSLALYGGIYAFRSDDVRTVWPIAP